MEPIAYTGAAVAIASFLLAGEEPGKSSDDAAAAADKPRSTSKTAARDASMPIEEDDGLVWREEEGRSKRVPLVPEPRGEKRTLRRYAMEEVAKHAARDDLWIVIDGRVYDVTKFVDRHPGGVLPLVDMAGKDCTDAFANYHAAKVYSQMLPAFLVGEVAPGYEIPEHVAAFRAARQELLRRGLFQTSAAYYAKLGAWLALLLAGGLYLSVGCATAGAHLAGAATVGIFWQQLAGLGHDLGHSGVSHRFRRDHLAGSLLASLMGISTSWWKRNHNTHHIVCNSVEHDPDIQHMPFLAVTPAIFRAPRFWSTYYRKWVSMDGAARWLVSRQHLLFYVVMGVARFNLYVQSWVHLLTCTERLYYRRVEIVALLAYAGWVVAVAASMPSRGETAGWLLVSHTVAGLLHVQITISHFAMHTYSGRAYNDETDEWYVTQCKTTMNVATPRALDWVHIGLQFQIEHHLFPRLPRHNLRHARALVRPICSRFGIEYHEPTFWQANVEVLRALRKTARAAAGATKGDGGLFTSPMWEGFMARG